MMRIKKYEGLVAAPFTPMDNKGRVITDMIPEYYRFLEKNEIAGAFINGSTGEGASMTQKEKQEAAVKWAEGLKAGGKMRIINLIGGTSEPECIENAVFSASIGLSAIAVVAPYYYKPDEVRLAEYITKIGQSVPDMPVYFYHIPVLTGVNMPMIGFLKRISDMLPNFAGIKYTHEDIMDFMQCLTFREGMYDLLWGRDECMIAALSVGATGAVGSTYNYAAPLYHALFRAFNEGDIREARRLQRISINIVELLGKYGGIATGKAYMKYIGIDCGKFRLPVRNMNDEAYGEFVKDVRNLGLEKYFSTK
jgi:N-acetylneuraminate lyase